MGSSPSAPTDLRPSPATPPYHRKRQTFLSTINEPGYYMILSRIIQDPANGLRRIPLPRTPVNRAERKDSGLYTRNQALTAEHLPSAQLLSWPPSSPAGG